MIFLDYLYNLPNATSGADTILVETVTAVPRFTSMLILFIFFVVFLGGIARQKARSGTADYPMWGIVASLSAFLITLILTLKSGLIGLDTLVIVVVMNIASAVWFFLDRKVGEF